MLDWIKLVSAMVVPMVLCFVTVLSTPHDWPLFFLFLGGGYAMAFNDHNYRRS